MAILLFNFFTIYEGFYLNEHFIDFDIRFNIMNRIKNATNKKIIHDHCGVIILYSYTLL